MKQIKKTNLLNMKVPFSFLWGFAFLTTFDPKARRNRRALLYRNALITRMAGKNGTTAWPVGSLARRKQKEEKTLAGSLNEEDTDSMASCCAADRDFPLISCREGE